MIEVDLFEPRHFAVDLDVRRGLVHFLVLEADVLERSVFLDSRIAASLSSAVTVPLDEIARARYPTATPAFLFHTSFCCSTLLARALHVPPASVALKEPLVLRRLGDARHEGLDVSRFLPHVARLLARPWSPDGRVVIKPTHAALNVAADLLEASPEAPAILLYGTLEDFVISNCKKPPDTQAKVPRLVERAIAASDWYGQLDARGRAPASFHELVALQWCAQLAVAHELFARVPRLRSLRELDLLADLAGTQRACAAWFDLPVPEHALASRLASAASEHAKAPGTAYDAAKRAEEQGMVRSMFGREIDGALAYAKRHLLPSLPSTELPRPLPTR